MTLAYKFSHSSKWAEDQKNLINQIEKKNLEPAEKAAHSHVVA